MPYVIKNSRGQTLVTLPSGEENTTVTSLTLLGAGFPAYGLQQNENFVYLLENFANSTPPENPVLGQLWYNSDTGILYQRNLASQWAAIASQSYVDAQKISPVFTGVPQAPTAANGTSSNQIATTAFVNNTINSAGFATIASPAFTGVPTAPTAANATANTQVATTAFVVNYVNDPNLSLYATKADANLTGVPIAPTAANSTNSTQLATTAFVKNVFNDTTSSLYATKLNAVLTGTPIAPTAANGTSSTQIATTAFVNNTFNAIDLAPYAPKASPILTGVPIAPTASAATNTTQLATTAFVQQQKISPAFTGTPTAPTAASGDNTTQIATTEFVTAAINDIDTSAASELAGSIKMWASATPPDNWALCNGQAVSRSTYATLFSRIGTTYGAGDGSTTFNLPNFTDRFPVGSGNAYAAGSTGGYADAAVITHTHPVSNQSVSINDPGHLHHGVLESAANPAGRRVTLNRAVGQNDNDATGGNLDDTTSVATTGITASVNLSLSAPAGSVSGAGRNIPPYIAGWWIIKLTDDGSGGGTLQAGAGIDITTGDGYSRITNTGVKSLTAGSGISITGSSGNLTITNTGSLPIITAGQGIDVVQNGANFVITNTVTAPPVIGGIGTRVTNTAGGAIVDANVVAITAESGSGITVSEIDGIYTIGGGGGLGVNQTWQNVIGSRSSGVTYTNSTGRPIMVCVTISSSSGSNSGSAVVGGVTLASWNNSSTQINFPLSFVVPPDLSYVVTVGGSSTINLWSELR